jgi:plasmid stabilization system protein ParE
VAALAALGSLRPAAAEVLRLRLESAAGFLAANRPAAAIHALRAFEDRARTLVETGRVAARDVRTLRAGGRCVIRRLGS